LKLIYDEALSIIAFNFNLRPYTMDMSPASSAQLASYFAAGAGVGSLAVGTVFGALTPGQGP